MNPEGTPVAVVDTYIEEQRLLNTSRFVVLCVLTGGLYTVWWQYRAWRFFSQWGHTDNLPALRATSSVFTVYPLLRSIRWFAQRQAIVVPYHSGAMAVVYILFALLALLPNPLGMLALLSCGPLVMAHQVFNRSLLSAPEVRAVEQTRFNRRQRFLIGFFCVMWVLMLLGLLLLAMS